MAPDDSYDADLDAVKAGLVATGLSQAEAGRRAGLRGNYASTRMHKLLNRKERSRPLVRRLLTVIEQARAEAAPEATP